MSEHRSDLGSAVGLSSTRSGRWLIAAVSAISLSGLALGAVLAPVSADDVAGTVGSGVSAEFDGNCVKIAAGGDGADGSVNPQGDGDPSGLDVSAVGTGTSDVSVCLDDLGEGLPEDPGGSVPGDPGGSVPGDPGGSVPGDLDGVADEVAAAVLGELDGAVPGEPDDGVPGDLDDVLPGGDGGMPGGPGDALPGDLGDGLPGDLGGLSPDGLGLVPALVDRLPTLVAGAADNGGPDGDAGNGPAVSPSTSGPGTASVGDGVDQGGDPGGPPLGGELMNGVPDSTGITPLPVGGALPRTGGGLGSGLLRMIAVLGIGRAALRLIERRRATAPA